MVRYRNYRNYVYEDGIVYVDCYLFKLNVIFFWIILWSLNVESRDVRFFKICVDCSNFISLDVCNMK